MDLCIHNGYEYSYIGHIRISISETLFLTFFPWITSSGTPPDFSIQRPTHTKLQIKQRYPKANNFRENETHLSSLITTLPFPMTTIAEALQSNTTTLALHH